MNKEVLRHKYTPNITMLNKEQLKELLYKYNNTLDKNIIEYLNSLIELEISAIPNYIINDEIINDDEKRKISRLNLYKYVFNYNIVNRILNLFEPINNEIDTVIKKDDDELRIFVNIDKSSFMLFSYSLIGSDKHKEFDDGKISLFKTLHSNEQRKKEIDRLKNLLEKLYSTENPFLIYDDNYGNSASNWTISHINKIEEYEKKLAKIQNMKELTDKDKKEIEISNMIHELLLEEFKLLEDDFVIEKINKPKEEITELYKTYVKRIPKIDIKNNIKYI